MFKSLISVDDFNKTIGTKDAVLVYFSHDKCNVCKALKPKVSEMVLHKFSKMTLCYSDTVIYPELAAQLGIFSVPTIIIFFGGKEFYRFSRNVGISELCDVIERPYDLMFG